MEMSAFSDAIFRTHPSNNPKFNAQIWDNAKIAADFKKFAEVFVELGDYKMELMQELEKTGIPMTRSLMLEFDDTDLHIDDQFMLGSKIMMAPIFTKGATSRKVYFPRGVWKHFFTGKVYQIERHDGEWRGIDCPIGTPAAFKLISLRKDY